MPADATTFFLAFAAVFGGLAAYLWRLDRSLRALEQRVELVEARAGRGAGIDEPPSGDRAATVDA